MRAFGLAVLILPLGFCAAAAGAGEAPAPDRKILETMDKVIADPRDPSARSALAGQAGAAVEAERQARERERDEILRSVKAREERRKALLEKKKRRLSGWERDFSSACSLASDPSRVAEAVAAYEGALETFPVYSDNAELLRASSDRIRGIFFGTIRKHFPYLAEGESALTDRMLAAAYFSESYRQQELYGGAERADSMNLQLRRAARLRELEAGLRARHADLSRAIYLYGKDDLDGASLLFKKVLASDRGNEEALYYVGLTADRRSSGSSRLGE